MSAKITFVADFARLPIIITFAEMTLCRVGPNAGKIKESFNIFKFSNIETNFKISLVTKL